MNSPLNISALAWEKVDHLMPAVIQDASTAEVLMLGYMNEEALQQTLNTNKVTFYSRTKKRLWTKGETSGNFLTLVSIATDCDNDTLLVRVHPAGPCCHRQTTSCFALEQIPSINFLNQLEATIAKRYNQPSSDSYTSKLFAAGTRRIAQKVGEEGVEVALAAVSETKEKLTSEAADLIYHLLVLLKQCDSGLDDVVEELQRRKSQVESNA